MYSLFAKAPGVSWLWSPSCPPTESVLLPFQLDKVIAGTVDRSTGEVLSIFQAVLRGLVDYDTGIRLLETQLLISGLISPALRKCFDLKDAQSHGLIDEQVLSHLQELNEAKAVMSAVSPATVPVLDALAKGVISEPTAIRVLEILLSTGSLVIPATGEQLTLQKAFQQHWISSALFSKILERQNTCKDLIDPSTSEKVSLLDLLQRSVLQENTGVRLLPVRPQEGGRITLKGGRSISILRAAHEGLVDRETMFRLLGAQLLSGGADRRHVRPEADRGGSRGRGGDGQGHCQQHPHLPGRNRRNHPLQPRQTLDCGRGGPV